MTNSNKIITALRRKAFGYTVSEQSTEYDSEGIEIKNKVTTKEVPPDMTALKMLIALQGEKRTMDERELELERSRLLNELKRINDKRGEVNGNNPM